MIREMPDALADWWADDPDYQEFLDEMERQDYERTIHPGA